MVDARGELAHSGDGVPELPGYRIERQLGRGSMGVVYLAEDVQLRRKVALKILSPTLSDDELFRKRFDRESQSAANLDHPSIVPVYAAGEAGGLLYIAMRYVGGGDVRALLDAGGPLRLEQASSMVASVADALDAAHALGVIHRDVKPANILIDSRNDQEHYYLSDFGITKIISSGRSLTSTGQIIGTIDYIAPEQIQGKAVDGRADLYALGCVLYECLTAEVPFPRDETAAAMWAHVHDEAPSVTTRRPDLPPQIDHIVAKAMAKQPEDRYATCRELATALRAAAGPAAAGEGRPVAPAGPIDRPPPPASSGMTSTYSPPTPASARAPATSSPPRWRWWWIAAAGVLALALVGGSTAGVMKYLSSRFPTAAEQALLDQVPLALQEACTRNSEAEADTANVQASVTCPSSGDSPNTTVFTQFKSAQALDDHYRTAVAAAGASPDSGSCLNTERAEGTYTNQSDGTIGRTVCYQQRGSSFVAWTDGQSHTLALATRVDRDYPKLRDWWAGVVGLPTTAQLEAEAKASKAIEEANKKAADEKKRADEAVQQTAETKNQQAEVDKKRAEDDKKKAEQQEREAEKKRAEDDKKSTEALKLKAEEDRKRAAELKQEAEDDKKRAEELKQQLPGSSQVSPQNLDGGQKSESPTEKQPPTAQGALPTNPTNPTNPTESRTGPQSPGAPNQLSTSAVTLSGPAPAAPGPQARGPQAPKRQAPQPQQGGSAAGSTGCTPTSAGYHLCTLAAPAPAYLPGTTKPSTVLRADKSAFLCQSDGSAYSVADRANHWWAWVGYGSLGVWVPTVFLAGSADNAPVAGLPVCSSAGGPNATTEQPSTPRGPSIIIEPFPTPPPRDSTRDDPPTFTFPF